MKKLQLTLLCLSLCIAPIVAQSPFEKLYKPTLDAYQKNPHKVFLELAADDFVLISGTGVIADKATTALFFRDVKTVDMSFTNQRIKEIGKTAIVTGHEHSVRHYENGTPDQIFDYLFTSTYEIRGDKLVLLSTQHTPVAPNPVTEQETIKTMLRQETIDAYAAKDVNSYFAQVPHLFRGWNTRTGYEVDMSWDAIKKKNESAFNTNPRKMEPINENFTFKFYGADACVVTYDQYLYGKENAAIPSKEIRVLEKQNGNWKIAGLLAMWDYSGNNFEQNNVRKTIEAETNAYHAGDVAALNKQWAYNLSYVERQQTYLKTTAGAAYFKGDALRSFGDAFAKVHKPTGQTYKILDYEAHVGSTNAWVTYTQETYNPDGKVASRTRELRILERVNGWKIVAMSNVEL